MSSKESKTDSGKSKQESTKLVVFHLPAHVGYSDSDVGEVCKGIKMIKGSVQQLMPCVFLVHTHWTSGEIRDYIVNGSSHIIEWKDVPLFVCVTNNNSAWTTGINYSAPDWLWTHFTKKK